MTTKHYIETFFDDACKQSDFNQRRDIALFLLMLSFSVYHLIYFINPFPLVLLASFGGLRFSWNSLHPILLYFFMSCPLFYAINICMLLTSYFEWHSFVGFVLFFTFSTFEQVKLYFR